MLTATPEIDTSLAQTQWDDFVQDAGQGLDKIAGKGNKVEDSLKGIGDEAKKTASAVASIDLAQKMEKAVGHIGDVKDILQKAGGAVFGFSKETTEAIGKVGDLAEKGASLGSAFGPIGAVVGAGLGALTGAFVAWSEATERARQEQEKLIRDTINSNFAILQKQKALVQASAKTWDDYALAVRRAGGVQISAIEAVLQAEQEATKKQKEDVEARAALWKKNIDFFVDLRKQRTLTLDEVNELTKNEVGYANTMGESWRVQQEALAKFSTKILPDLEKAFDGSDKSTEEFNKALAKIGKEETLKDLQTDLVDAQTELTNAETKVKDLKVELTAGPKENEGFFDYMARLKVLLIDSQNAANDLATAQGAVLGAAGAVDSKKKSSKGPKGKSEAQLNAEANAEFERQLRNSEEQARQADIQAELDYWAELDRITEEGWQAQRDAVNNAIKAEQEAQKKADADAIQAEKDRIAQVQQIKKDNDEKEKQRKAEELAATQAFYDSIKMGAVDVGATVANALAGEAVQAFDAYLDAVANGEKRTKESNKRQRVEFLRKTGSMLVTDGTGHVIAGTVKGISGDPLGWAEAIAGAGEIAVGVGMGGVGALGQRSLGGTQAKADSQKTSGPSVGGGSTGTQTLAPVVINFSSVTPASEREQQEIGDKLKGLISASDRRSR